MASRWEVRRRGSVAETGWTCGWNELLPKWSEPLLPKPGLMVGVPWWTRPVFWRAAGGAEGCAAQRARSLAGSWAGVRTPAGPHPPPLPLLARPCSPSAPCPTGSSRISSGGWSRATASWPTASMSRWAAGVWRRQGKHRGAAAPPQPATRASFCLASLLPQPFLAATPPASLANSAPAADASPAERPREGRGQEGAAQRD